MKTLYIFMLTILNVPLLLSSNVPVNFSEKYTYKYQFKESICDTNLIHIEQNLTKWLHKRIERAITNIYPETKVHTPFVFNDVSGFIVEYTGVRNVLTKPDKRWEKFEIKSTKIHMDNNEIEIVYVIEGCFDPSKKFASRRDTGRECKEDMQDYKNNFTILKRI